NAYASGIGELLQPRGDIDAFPIAVFALDDHLAEIDPDTDIDATILLDRGVALGHAALQCNRAFDRIDHAAELSQKTIAHELEYAAVVVDDFRFEEVLSVGPERLERSGLVLLHQAAVADHIGGEDSGKATFHGRLHWH